jgi:hypothetical protein
MCCIPPTLLIYQLGNFGFQLFFVFRLLFAVYWPNAKDKALSASWARSLLK